MRQSWSSVAGSESAPRLEPRIARAPSMVRHRGEVSEKSFLAQPEKPVLLDHSCARRRLWIFRAECAEVLTRVRRAADVHQRRNLRVIARFADDRSRKGVAHQHRRPILQGKDSASCGNVIRQ